jgi:hypothetical protein
MSTPDVLTLRIGSRFLIVTLFPNLVFALLIGALMFAGAPSHRPDWHRLEQRLQDLSVVGVVLLGVSVLAFSVALHPLNYTLVQLMEGYWRGLPFGDQLQRSAEARGNLYRRELRRRGANGADVAALLYWLPPGNNPVRPTMLGNVLFAGEVRAGSRYGYWTEVVWPRLMPLLSDQIRSQLGDARNQLDAAARLASVGLLGV